MNKILFHLIRRGIFILVVLGLSACNLPQTEAPQPTQVAVSPTPSVTPAPTSTQGPGKVFLIHSQETTTSLGKEVENLLTELSSGSDLIFEVIPIATKDQITEEVEIVVSLHPDHGLQELAAARPDTQFLGIGIQGLVTGNNLSVIGPEGFRTDQIDFLAGYISAMITPDWRVGMLGGKGAQISDRRFVAFSAGVRFYCGLCRQAYPPFNDYPISIEVDPANPVSITNAIEQLKGLRVETVYVILESIPEVLVLALEDQAIEYIGGEIYKGDGMSHLIATISFDPTQPLREAWDVLVAQEGGLELPLPIVINNVNPDLLSLGRKNHAQDVLADLQAGFIDTGVGDPTEYSQYNPSRTSFKRRPSGSLRIPLISQVSN